MATASTPARRLRPRHEDILEQLQAIFLTRGFRDLTIEMLAAELKCSKRTFYDIANSKQELFLVVFERFLQRLLEQGIESLQEVSDPAERMVRFMEAGISDALAVSSQAMEDVQSLRPASLMLEAHVRARIDILQQLVKEGVEQGQFRPLHVQLVAECCFAALTVSRDAQKLQAIGVKPAEAIKEIYELFAYGLLRRD